MGTKTKTGGRETREGAFQALRHDPACRVCDLALSNAELFAHLHARWRVKPDAGLLCSESASVFKASGAPALEPAVVSIHFAEHVRLRNAPAGAAPVLPVPGSRPVGSVSVGVGGSGRHETEYFEMQDIIDRLRRRLVEVDTKVTLFDGDGKVQVDEGRLLMKIMDSLRSTLESLSKMRNSDKLTRAILKAHTKRFVQHLSGPLVSRFDDALERIRSTEASDESIAELERLVRQDVKELIFSAAEAAVRESSDVYWLH